MRRAGPAIPPRHPNQRGAPPDAILRTEGAPELSRTLLKARSRDYSAATTLPTSRPRVMAMPIETPAMGVKYAGPKRRPQQLPVA